MQGQPPDNGVGLVNSTETSLGKVFEVDVLVLGGGASESGSA